MKKLILLLIIIGAFSCKKNNTQPTPEKTTVTFYASDSTKKWGVIFDGVDYGQIKYSQQAPNCSGNGLITVDVEPGNHKYILKSYSGLAWGSEKQISIPKTSCYSLNINK